MFVSLSETLWRGKLVLLSSLGGCDWSLRSFLPERSRTLHSAEAKPSYSRTNSCNWAPFDWRSGPRSLSRLARLTTDKPSPHFTWKPVLLNAKQPKSGSGFVLPHRCSFRLQTSRGSQDRAHTSSQMENDTHDHWLWKTGYRVRRNRKCCSAPLQNSSLARMTVGWCPHTIKPVAELRFRNCLRSPFLQRWISWEIGFPESKRKIK